MRQAARLPTPSAVFVLVSAFDGCCDAMGSRVSKTPAQPDQGCNRSDPAASADASTGKAERTKQHYREAIRVAKLVVACLLWRVTTAGIRRVGVETYLMGEAETFGGRSTPPVCGALIRRR